MKLWAFIVARNEVDKFLASWIAHHAGLFDGVHVYDDQSTDDTRQVCLDAGYAVTTRPESAPSFLDHEGMFRSNAWDAAVDELGVRLGDIIYAPDLDEFFMGNWPGAVDAVKRGRIFNSPLPDIWRLDPPLARVDGAWRSNAGIRLDAYDPHNAFRPARCGPGSVPQLSHGSRVRQTWPAPPDHSILHFGYAFPGAQRIKYDRYSDTRGNRHSPDHIESILRQPVLEPYKDEMPDVWLGLSAPPM